MDRGAWRAAVHGVARVRQKLTIKPNIYIWFIYIYIYIYIYIWREREREREVA